MKKGRGHFLKSLFCRFSQHGSRTVKLGTSNYNLEIWNLKRLQWTWQIMKTRAFFLETSYLIFEQLFITFRFHDSSHWSWLNICSSDFFNSKVNKRLMWVVRRSSNDCRKEKPKNTPKRNTYCRAEAPFQVFLFYVEVEELAALATTRRFSND